VAQQAYDLGTQIIFVVGQEAADNFACWEKFPQTPASKSLRLFEEQSPEALNFFAALRKPFVRKKSLTTCDVCDIIFLSDTYRGDAKYSFS